MPASPVNKAGRLQNNRVQPNRQRQIAAAKEVSGEIADGTNAGHSRRGAFLAGFGAEQNEGEQCEERGTDSGANLLRGNETGQNKSVPSAADFC